MLTKIPDIITRIIPKIVKKSGNLSPKIIPIIVANMIFEYDMAPIIPALDNEYAFVMRSCEIVALTPTPIMRYHWLIFGITKRENKKLSFLISKICASVIKIIGPTEPTTIKESAIDLVS